MTMEFAIPIAISANATTMYATKPNSTKAIATATVRIRTAAYANRMATALTTKAPADLKTVVRPTIAQEIIRTENARTIITHPE